MSGRFSDQVVLITGGAKGIGAGCARVFHREGAKGVIVLDKDEAAGLRLAAELSSVHFQCCDLCDFESFRLAVAEEVDKLGRLDCIINNVGWHPPQMPLTDVSLSDFETLVRLNLTTTFAGCQFALPHLRRTKGSIVIMTSISAIVGEKESSSYCATKAGQIGLMKALAIELAPDIRVNAVAPGGVDTPLMREWANSFPDPQALIDSEARLHVLHRLAKPEEIGRVCLFLATEDSSFVTGTVILADGGTSLCHPR